MVHEAAAHRLWEVSADTSAAASYALLPAAGNVASVYMVDALGRRWTSCVCMAGACVCALAFALAPARGIWPTAAACVFNAVSVGGWNRQASLPALHRTARHEAACTTRLPLRGGRSFIAGLHMRLRF